MVKYYAGSMEIKESDFYPEKILGVWWNDRDIEIVDIGGTPVALYGWNGEAYTKCFKVKEPIGDTYLVWHGAGEDLPESVTPVYKDNGGNEDLLLVGYYYPCSI